MSGISATYKLLPGKTGGGNSWLPLWMHLEDTAAVMRYLCEKRVPPSVIRTTGLEREEFNRVAGFLSRVHDLGKCMPLFASKIMSAIPERRQILERNGVEIPIPRTRGGVSHCRLVKDSLRTLCLSQKRYQNI